MVSYRDKRMEKYVKARKFVPYALPTQKPKRVVGKFYWSGKAGKYYKVLEIIDGEAKVMWSNKKLDFILEPLDSWIDYLVKPFEWKSDESPVDKNVSLTFCELKALNCGGVISHELESRIKPKGHVYYYLTCNNSRHSAHITRDKVKSQRMEKNHGIYS